MRYPEAPWLLPALVAGLLTLAPAWQRPPDEVDLALVLAVDVSTSMDPDEQDLQRQGYVEAFRSPSVHQAIHGGVLGRIAVTYVEWAGAHPHVQHVVVPWTVLDDAKDSLSFADRLARAPIRRGAGTSIAEAIDFSLGLPPRRPCGRRGVSSTSRATARTIRAPWSPKRATGRWPAA